MSYTNIPAWSLALNTLIWPFDNALYNVNLVNTLIMDCVPLWVSLDKAWTKHPPVNQNNQRMLYQQLGHSGSSNIIRTLVTQVGKNHMQGNA